MKRPTAALRGTAEAQSIGRSTERSWKRWWIWQAAPLDTFQTAEKTLRRIVHRPLGGIISVLLVAVSLTISGPSPSAQAAESISFDFNTAGDLAADFNSFIAAGTISQSATGGIGNSGAIQVDHTQTANAVFATKDGYSLGPVDSTYTFSAQMRSRANGGYSGMGFTSLIPGVGKSSGVPYRPTDALGISVHGGGYVFHNGASDVSGNWSSTYTGASNLYTERTSFGITTACDDSTQDSCWYKVVFKISRTTSTAFTARVELYDSSQSGTLDPTTAISIIELRNQTNSTLTNAAQIYSYINFSGVRMQYFDDFQVDLAGGASVISAGSPVVLTSSASQSSGVVTVAGNVTADGGASVTDRGFVYGTSANPTTSNNKVASGTGTGSFSATTPQLSAGTYYFRAYATNSTGTSYGSQETLTIKGDQTIAWAPSTSLTLADSGLSLSATRTVGDGTLGYTVVSSGTTGCSVSGSTLTFASTGSGANGCEVRPTLTGTDAYNAKTNAATVTFDISRGTFAISSPSSKVGVTSASFTDTCVSTCDVTGFAPADEILVIVSKSDGNPLSGRVRLGSTTGLVQSQTGYQTDATAANGHPELAFIGTQAEVNAALETLQYKGPAGGGDETLGISASLSGAAYFAATGSFYEVVNVGSSVGWEDARCRALYGNSSAHDDSPGLTQTDSECTNTGSRRTLNGLNGYLANITSLDEHNFLRTKLSDVGWIGGADLDTEGTFQWVDGPEAGQTFFISGTSTRRTTNTINGVSQFNYFSDGEPNNSSGAEDFVEFGFGSNGVGSSWNDCQNSCGGRTRFVVEYGGDGGAVLKQASTTFEVGAPTAPLQVSGESATAGNSQLVLSWSAPNTGGSAITDYVVEQFDPDTSTWTILTDGVSATTTYTVTGLTNGTSYSFRVSAKNLIGTGTASSTFSGTPAAPAPSGSGSNATTPTPVVVPLAPATPRIITPQQPTARPVPLQAPVTSPGRPLEPSAGPRATIGGAPATVSSRALPSGGVAVQAGTFQLGVTLSNPTGGGGVETTSGSSAPELRVPAGQSTTVNGGGLLPGSQLQVWLPGRTGSEVRELARIPVKPDGTFEAELSFTARQSDTPVPIGRQVMQVTGYDEAGRQTVVDMTINVAQGPITPELNRNQGQLPQLTPGASLATSAGFLTPTILTLPPEQDRLSIGDGEWMMTIGVDGNQGAIQGTAEAPLVKFAQNSDASASGEGFLPGTTASVWMFSDPTLMATVKVGADGAFTAEFFVDPLFLAAGQHTLQIQAVGEDGFIKAANLGVLIEEPVSLTSQSSSSLLIWMLGLLAVIITIVLVMVVSRTRKA